MHSSHLVSDLERVCDYLIVLVGSRVRLAGDVARLLAATAADRAARDRPPGRAAASGPARAADHLLGLPARRGAARRPAGDRPGPRPASKTSSWPT